MPPAEARAWWADVEHLREAAERRQSADAERRAREQRSAERRARADAETTRARSRAAHRVVDAGAGAVDELSARRAVFLDERAPRARRPVPIWLADDAFTDPVTAARARAAAPRRTVEIRGQITVADAPPAREPERSPAPIVRRQPSAGLAASFAARP